ncbi:MAG: TipAS antibiotic-recognition domain-containing protein [Bacillota bacterium]
MACKCDQSNCDQSNCDQSTCGQLTEEQQVQYRAEAVDKYGKSVVEDSQKRIDALGKEGIADLQALWFEICNVIYERRDYGVADKFVQEQAGKLHQWVNNFWDCDIVAFKGLGRTYNSSADFRANIIRQFGGEMPAFLEKVISHYCAEASKNH